MKKNFALVFFVCCILVCDAQTVYHLQYNQLISNQKVKTYALFFQNDDGSGFLRTRYQDPVSKEERLLELTLMEDMVPDTNNNADTTKLYIRTINPEVILGDAQAVKHAPLFLFTLNTNTGEMEMQALVTENEKGEKIIDEQASLHATYVHAGNITKELFANYFQEGEEFFENYFKANTKEISAAEKKIRMHLLIVADTLAHDIGRSCALDIKRVLMTFTYIAAYIGCKVNIRIVAGPSYNKRSVVSELKLLKPASNDIVIFYYTGHGFRKPTDKRRYPYLDLRAKGESDYLKQSLNMEDIYQQIKQKGARTNLVLSDCCNSYVGSTNAIGSKPFKKKSIVPELNSQFVKSLFLNKISLLATAADSTQKASGNPNFGGFFSYFLKISVENNCSKNAFQIKNRATSDAPTWYDVLNETQKLTYQKAQLTYCDKPYIRENICNQTPCFRIER